MKGIYTIILGACVLLFSSCQSNSSSTSELKEAMTFYASFDNGTKADFALGEANMYTAKASYVNSKRVLDSIEVGMRNPDHELVKGKGRFGDAFSFGSRDGKIIYYKSKNNIAFNLKDWTGTISFWLSVDPNIDLDGYTDPIQITDKSYNDASIWVDFTDKAPKDFRLGVFGDKNEWTRDTLNMPANEAFAKRLVTVKANSFSSDSWTHVLISYNGLGKENAKASLYLNGEKLGTIEGTNDPFTWNLEQSNIFLGLGFKGLMDDLAIFNKSLTDQQAKELYQLKGGIKSIL